MNPFKVGDMLRFSPGSRDSILLNPDGWYCPKDSAEAMSNGVYIVAKVIDENVEFEQLYHVTSYRRYYWQWFERVTPLELLAHQADCDEQDA